MDPLEGPFVDVREFILQHLNAKDVIKCSQVSSSWNEIVGASRHCMKQVWLRLDQPPKQVNTLRRSMRLYENFRIQPGARRELSEIMKDFRPRNVITADEHDEEISYGDYYDFMSSMAPTIENLQPGEGLVTRAPRGKLKAINFPKLTELQCTLTNRNAFSIYLGSNPNLKKVLMSFNGEIPHDLLVPTNIVHDFFKRNPQIENLFMCEVDGPFQTDITKDIELDLKCFSFAKTNAAFTWNVSDNLVKFVKLQKNLEWLKIFGLHDWNVFLRIWTEGWFRKLFIMDCSLKGAIHGRVLPKNLHIIEINFYLNSSCHIVKFLQASPHLKAFKVRQLSKQLMEFSARCLPCLELIQFQSIENCVEQHYSDLKETTDDDVNRRIRLEEMDFFEFVGRDAGF